MLNGIDPILLFHFSVVPKSIADKASKVPILATIIEKVGLPPIPIYLSESVTGLFIESEESSIEIETSTETLTSGLDPLISQKALASTVTINMIGSSNSIGLTLLSALADLVFPKVTSLEYSITYLHKGVTVFNGLLHSFRVSQGSNDDLYRITLSLSKSNQKPKQKENTVEIKPVSETSDLASGVSPTAPLKPPLKGPPGSSLPVQPPVKMGGLG